MKKLGLLLILAITVGCFIACTPTVPPYPYRPIADLDREAQAISDNLEAYIKDWVAGKVSSTIPDNLIPSGVSRVWTPKWELKNPDTMTERHFGIRKATTRIDFNAIQGLFPDAHCTYYLAMSVCGPFGSKMVMTGQFPYCRFFSAQIAPPYDGRFYYQLGAGELAVVDADIIPDSGSVNPFLPGANRLATNRNYTLTFDFKKGDAIALNGTAANRNYYRRADNYRVGSGIQYAGPWGDPNWAAGHNGNKLCDGQWLAGDLWVRNYGIDKNKDYTAGVPMPKLYQQLATGEKFRVWTDPNIMESYRCKTKPAPVVAAGEPNENQNGKTIGWVKQYGIFNAIISGMMWGLGQTDKKYVRDLVLGVTGTGESQPGWGSREPSTSCCNHFNYMLRGMDIPAGKVACLAGKLPTFPNTRNGATTMQAGTQMRYLSFCSYEQDSNAPDGTQGSNCTSVMDDEIVIDGSRNYVICYSTAADKPTNATSAAGVTWVNWGPTGHQGITVRWCSVYPDWYATFTPNEDRVTWSKTSWSGANDDPNILRKNDRTGFLGVYQPVMYYMTKASFQGLGTPVTEAKLKTISWGCGSNLIADSSGKWMVLVPLMLLVFANGIWFMRRRR